MFPYIDLQSNNGHIHTHTAAGTAEKVTGFTAGAFIRVCANAALAYVGVSKEDAESKKISIPAATSLIVKLPNQQTHIWLDGPNGSVITAAEVLWRS
jgi:hypothetical protein